jgi:hypothetical protein
VLPAPPLAFKLNSPLRLEGLRRVSPVRGQEDNVGKQVKARSKPLRKAPEWFRLIEKRGKHFNQGIGLQFQTPFLSFRSCVGEA